MTNIGDGKRREIEDGEDHFTLEPNEMVELLYTGMAPTPKLLSPE